MKNLIENKKIIVLCLFIILIIGIGSYLIKNHRTDKSNIYSEKSDYSFLKNYGVNEYVPVTVNQEAMIKIYITEFKNLMVTDPERAYSYLNEEYRNKRFGSYENFIQYVNEIQSIVFFDYEVKKYNVSTNGKNKIIYVNDDSDYLYIFKEKSIMQYEVYLDNNTVEIK